MTVVESAQRFGAATRTRRTVRWVLLVGAVVLVGVAVWLVWFSSVLSVTQVRVLGATTVSADLVRQTAAVPPAQPLARVDVAGITARVAAIPQVAGVEVRRGWPDVLVIVVTERVPVVVLKDGSGWTYADATGVRFGAPATPPHGMPIVTAASDQALVSAAAVVDALPQPLRATVTAVSARTRDDVVLTLSGGASVRWGSADESARKAAVLAALVKVRATYYDVSAPDLPTTRGTSPAPSPS